MFHPVVFIPLRSLIHVKPIVNEELSSSPEVLASFDRRNLPEARMEGVHPLAVGTEAVIHFVSQGGAVVLS